jgi:hypothetical protein
MAELCEAEDGGLTAFGRGATYGARKDRRSLSLAKVAPSRNRIVICDW